MYRHIFQPFLCKSINITLNINKQLYQSPKFFYNCLFFDIRLHSSCKKMEAVSGEKVIFSGVTDKYKGVTIDSKREPCNILDFPNKLDESLSIWTQSGQRAIWFKVSTPDSDWVPVLVKNGFEYHHAQEGFVMMYKWLPGDKEICNLPPFAHTNLGVGCVVINEHNQVLVVSEKYFDVPHWKLPGGYVEIGEDVSEAAMREVKEETGIDTDYHSIIGFRHAHKMMFGCSDIYMIVNLIPRSSKINMCERELVKCVWMDISEYMDHPDIHILNKMLVRKTMEYKERGIKLSGIKDTYQLLTMKKEFTVFTIDDY